MKILFITSTRIGDAVLSTGLLHHLVARHPGARVTIACGPAPVPLFVGVPGLDRVIVLAKRPLASHWLRLWAACAPVAWDLVVDLRQSLASRLLSTRERKALRGGRGQEHQVRRLGAVLGLDPPPSPHLWIGAREAAEAARLIPAGPPVLGLGPTANWAPKAWPADRFVALAERLTGRDGLLPGARIAVFGADNERAMAAPVVAALPADRRIDLAGRTGLGVAAACFARVALYIGNDSGLMHMAAAAGIPTLGLFGPSPAAVYAPWGDRAAFVSTAIPFERLVGASGFDHRATACLMDSLSVDAAHAGAVALWRRCRGEAA
ncbi:MAG TPA: glycosyltransferase family 9 protein [Alphaproteobacteria bacterium]